MPPPRARAGAVLVLIEDTRHGPRFVLTRRRQDLRSHPGQVSFPGGRIESGETVEQAALREAAEEIGLDPSSVDVVGVGSRFYIPPSRFWVVPVVARWREVHPLTENPWEVDEVLTVPLPDLIDDRRLRHVPLSQRANSWAWQLDDDLLWGATAMVIASVLDIAVPGWSGGRRAHDLSADRQVHPWNELPEFPRRRRLAADLPVVAQADVAHVTAAQVRSVRAWMDRRGMDLAARSALAGSAVADAVSAWFGEDGLAGRRVTVLAGPSTNGAAGLATAMVLAARGAAVEAVTLGAPRLTAQTHLLRDAGVPVTAVDASTLAERDPGDLVVDAMLGVGSTPPLVDLPLTASEWLRHYAVPIIAVDLPSGLDADHGVRGTCMTVDVTVALGLPTRAVAHRMAQAYVGDLYVAEVGIPDRAWRDADVDLPLPLFSDGRLVRLTRQPAGGRDPDAR